METFSGWVQKRNGDDVHIPEADRVVPMVTAAGPTGVTRRRLGHAINLEPDALDSLLDGLCQSGLLTMTLINGIKVFRSPSA